MTISNNDGKAVAFLSEDFVPSPNEVIIGRGKNISNHIGNLRLRSIVQSKLEEYSHANSDKTHKTYIISQILHEMNRHGRFVKKDTKTGSWYHIKNPAARAHIAQIFRDALHDSYRSSKFSKLRRRWDKSSIQAATVTSNSAPGMLPKIDAPQNSLSSDFLLSRLSYCNLDQEKPQKQQSERGIVSPDGTGGLKGIMDEALAIFESEEPLWAPTPPAPVFTDKHMFDCLFASFVPVDDGAEPVGNPFEPIPLLDSALSA